jgi:hypothetical protein
MSTLKTTLESLASDFASQVLLALRGASIDELMEVSRGTAARRPRAPGVGVKRRGKGGRLGRRSTAELEAVLDSIVGLLEKNPKGMRAEQIRESLGVEAKELPRPLAEGLSNGSLKKTGQKRATTYFAGSRKKKG